MGSAVALRVVGGHREARANRRRCGLEFPPPDYPTGGSAAHGSGARGHGGTDGWFLVHPERRSGAAWFLVLTGCLLGRGASAAWRVRGHPTHGFAGDPGAFEVDGAGIVGKPEFVAAELGRHHVHRGGGDLEPASVDGRHAVALVMRM